MIVFHNPHNKIPVYAYSFINLNFSEDGKHGCDFNCPFCLWKNKPICSVYMNPSNESIENFLKISISGCVGLSGGGDPLYNFEKNKKELERIIDLLHKHGRKTMLITRDYKALGKEWNNPIIKKFDRISISVDTCNEEVLSVLKHFNKNILQVSTVINGNNNYMSIENIKKYIDFYKNYCTKIQLRKDYMFKFDTNKEQEILNLINDYKKNHLKCHIQLIGGKDMILLINNDVYLTSDIDNNELEGIEKYF